MELPTDLIDLREYLDVPARAYITGLYSTLSIELQPNAWLWRLRDVCELYFRLQHDDIPLRADVRVRALLGVTLAIHGHLEDEYA